VASAADGTEVAVTTFRGTAIADAIVPLAACFVRPPAWLIDLFLFARIGAISCTVLLEVTSFEVPETSNFGKFNVFDLSSIPANGFVQINDF